MRALLRALNNPHLRYPSIIVAGTNGKGSTCATLGSILNASGYRAGVYTSPHLVGIRERWTVGGAPIDEELFETSIEILHRGAGAIGIAPTYFEALTMIAFIAFERAQCEIAVLEVGMGGRLDATNVVRPLAALITPIGFDHTEFLGSTIRQIASEKAGVIHRGAIVLTTNRDPVVVSVLERRARKFGNPFHVVTSNPPAAVPLPGTFQRDNAALAARAAEELMSRLPRITPASIVRGVANTRWRGRLERMCVKGKEVWIDGLHNAHAAAAVAPFIKDLRRPRRLVFGIMADKDIHQVAALLFPLFDAIVTTEPYPPRSAVAASLAEMATRFGIPAAAIPDPKEAIREALRSDEPLIFVGGSLYLAGAAIELLDPMREDDGDEQE